MFWSHARLTATLLVAALGTLAIQYKPAGAETQVGLVTGIQAYAQALTDNRPRRLSDNTPIYLKDMVTTGTRARLEITFKDGSRMTLGETARLEIDKFVFERGSRKPAVSLFAKGAFRFVTGLAGKAEGNDIRVRTPLAVIGIRGTDFFGGTVDGQYGVLLFEGAVSVTNTFGQSLLSSPGQGTNIAGQGQPPGPVTTWPEEKVDRALSLIEFQ